MSPIGRLEKDLMDCLPVLAATVHDAWTWCRIAEHVDVAFIFSALRMKQE